MTIKHPARFLALNTFISALPAKAFDLDCIFQEGESLQPLSKHAPCGSVGCVCGWAPAVPEFKKFELRQTDGDFMSNLWGGREDYDDMAVILFGISKSSAYELFNPVWGSDLDGDLKDIDLSSPSGKIGRQIYFARVNLWCERNNIDPATVLPARRIKKATT